MTAVQDSAAKVESAAYQVAATECTVERVLSCG